MTALQVAGNSLQLLGVVITGLGLLHAWNRASGRLDQWRQSVTSILAEADLDWSRANRYRHLRL